MGVFPAHAGVGPRTPGPWSTPRMFPAQAGVDRELRAVYAIRHCIPRTCGGGPCPRQDERAPLDASLKPVFERGYFYWSDPRAHMDPATLSLKTLIQNAKYFKTPVFPAHAGGWFQSADFSV